MQLCRRCPNGSPALGFPSVVEAGKNEQRYEDASKEVTTPAGVAVVRFMQGFHPALPSTPTPPDTLQGVAFGLTTDEKRAKDATAEQEG
jgi:hypothetical protein